MTEHDPLGGVIAEAEAELAALTRAQDEARERLARLRATAIVDRPPGSTQIALPLVQAVSPSGYDSASAKIRLFRSLFRGRTDVFPKRWENANQERSGYSPACAKEWVRGVCEKPKVKCGECPNQAFIAVDDRIIADHLRGALIAGVYPLLTDDTCWFVAADFDEESWKDDVTAVAEVARSLGLAPAVERSRSGEGAHLWFFFTQPVPATDARNMASFLLTETMRLRRELSLRSYDRLFPSQNTLPQGGFGNLIALPFQAALRKAGNSLFIDDKFEAFPWDQQWRFLSELPRMSAERVREIAREATRTGRLIGVANEADEDDDSDSKEPWNSPSRSGANASKVLPFAVPSVIHARLAQRVFIEKEGVPAPLLARFRRLAAFQNPEFYKRQKLRLSTGLTPRIIVCAEDFPSHLALPRACLDDVRALLEANGAILQVSDQRNKGATLEVQFGATLTAHQQVAVAEILKHDFGVLVAPPGAGKTVMGTAITAARGVSTLVLVHRRPLLEQWVNQLSLFLGIPPTEIGQIGGGRSRPTGRLDVAMIQSLVRGDKVAAGLDGYGHIIVDECHHVPALSFERVAASLPARFVTGLTATPRRRDGHHPIGRMQLGPVRHTMDAKLQAAARPFVHRLFVRETAFTFDSPDRPAIQDLYRALVNADERNRVIAHDVALAVEQGRNPIVLTERKDHLSVLADLVRGICPRVVVLSGGAGAAARAQALAAIQKAEARVLVAIGRYVGEGFDDPRLDTLFLAMPVSWKGTLVQYAGRIQRLHPGKREVRIYDYVDRNVAMLDRMFRRRLVGYRSIGYSEGEIPVGYADVDDDFVLGRGWEEDDEPFTEAENNLGESDG